MGWTSSMMLPWKTILYIHWYVWTSYAGLLPMKLGFNIIRNVFFAFDACLLSLPLLLLGVTLCIQRYKHQWFLIDAGAKNPYKLVYRVLNLLIQFVAVPDVRQHLCHLQRNLDCIHAQICCSSFPINGVLSPLVDNMFSSSVAKSLISWCWESIVAIFKYKIKRKLQIVQNKLIVQVAITASIKFCQQL